MFKTLRDRIAATTAREQSDPDVPPSERGKGENMRLDQRSPSSIFGLAALSYMILLIIVLGGIILWFVL